MRAEHETAGWLDAFALYLAARVRAHAPLVALLDTQGAAASSIRFGHDLVRLGQSLAQRFERLLADPPRQAAEPDGLEISGYLERLPKVLANAHGLPEAALRRIVRDLADRGHACDSIEPRLTAPIMLLRQATAFASAPPITELAALRGETQPHIAAGRFEVAGSVLEAAEAAWPDASSPAIVAEIQWARGLCAALRADIANAKAHVNRAIELTGTATPRTVRRYRLTLAHAHASLGHPADLRAALTHYAEIASAEAPGESLTTTIPAAIGLGAAVIRLARPQRNIRWLTLAAQVLRRAADAPVPILPETTRAHLWQLFGEVCLVLARQGAERDDEIELAFSTAARLAESSGAMSRLSSVCRLHLGDLIQRRQTATEMRDGALLYSAMAHFLAAQHGPLRERDPIVWGQVKLRIGESFLSSSRSC